MASDARALWMQSTATPRVADSSLRLPLRRPNVLSATAQAHRGGVPDAGLRKPTISSVKQNANSELSGATSFAHTLETSVLPNTPEKDITTDSEKELTLESTILDLNENYIPSCGSLEIYEQIKQTMAEWRARQPTFDEFLVTPSDCGPYVGARKVFTIPNLNRPIGIATLANGNIAIGVTGENKVKIFSSDGKFLRCASSPRDLRRPSDMVTLSDGRLVVRDDRGILTFDQDGNYLSEMGDSQLGRCYGLAADGQGHLLTLNTNFNGMYKSTPTLANETDIFLLDIETGKVHQRIELVDVIEDKVKSKCRFIHFQKEKLYIVDLGLNMIYVMNLNTALVKRFGGTGQRVGQFMDAAGIAVDRMGNMLVADAGNNRIQLFDSKRKFLGVVRLDAPLNRPSGLHFDIEALEPVIYVLNLNHSNMIKIQLIKE